MNRISDESFTACPRKNGRFINPYAPDSRRRLWDFVLWKMGYYDLPEDTQSIPHGFKYPLPQQSVQLQLPTVQWINHSTFLIQVDGVTLLTDPIWSQRCSPVNFVGPKRLHDVSVSIEELPRIDYVLISHDHYDHLDLKTVKRLQQLNPRIIWVVPQEIRKWFKKLGIERVVELAWWESAPIGEGIKVTAVPAQHFSGRYLRTSNKTLWAGYVVQFPSRRLYFTGDTGYNSYDFRKIGAKWGSMDLSLIPVGCYLPRAFMAPVHADPFDAVNIHREVGSKLSYGMHWKTFRLSEEGSRAPYDLYLAMQRNGLDPLTFIAPDPGYVINW